MKHIFIVNPVAGQRNAGTELIPEIIQVASQLGVDHKIHLTEYPGHATELARQYAASGEEVRLYACGGDGTFHEVVEGILDHPEIAVGCIPCGSGNDFIRNFGEKQDFHQLAEMISGEDFPVDIIQTNYGPATSSCSVGLDSQVAYGIGSFRRIPGCGGSMAYVLSALREICGKLGKQLKITLDDEVLEGEYLLAAACNGIAYGGGFLAAPEARLDDGLMDVILVRKISRLRILPILGVYRAGKHIVNGAAAPAYQDVMLFRTARKLVVEAMPGDTAIMGVDGECAPRTILTAEVIPAAFKTVLPKALAEKYQESAPAAAH